MWTKSEILRAASRVVNGTTPRGVSVSLTDELNKIVYSLLNGKRLHSGTSSAVEKLHAKVGKTLMRLIDADKLPNKFYTLEIVSTKPLRGQDYRGYVVDIDIVHGTYITETIGSLIEVKHERRPGYVAGNSRYLYTGQGAKFTDDDQGVLKRKLDDWVFGDDTKTGSFICKPKMGKMRFIQFKQTDFAGNITGFERVGNIIGKTWNKLSEWVNETKPVLLPENKETSKVIERVPPSSTPTVGKQEDAWKVHDDGQAYGNVDWKGTDELLTWMGPNGRSLPMDNRQHIDGLTRVVFVPEGLFSQPVYSPFWHSIYQLGEELYKMPENPNYTGEHNKEFWVLGAAITRTTFGANNPRTMVVAVVCDESWHGNSKFGLRVLVKTHNGRDGDLYSAGGNKLTDWVTIAEVPSPTGRPDTPWFFNPSGDNALNVSKANLFELKFDPNGVADYLADAGALSDANVEMLYKPMGGGSILIDLTNESDIECLCPKDSECCFYLPIFIEGTHVPKTWPWDEDDCGDWGDTGIKGAGTLAWNILRKGSVVIAADWQGEKAVVALIEEREQDEFTREKTFWDHVHCVNIVGNLGEDTDMEARFVPPPGGGGGIPGVGWYLDGGQHCNLPCDGEEKLEYSINCGEIDEDTGEILSLDNCCETTISGTVTSTRCGGSDTVTAELPDPAPLTLHLPDQHTGAMGIPHSGGRGPYTYSVGCGEVSESGWWTLPSDCCGEVSVTVTGACGDSASGSLRAWSGGWHLVSADCASDHSNCPGCDIYNCHCTIFWPGESKSNYIQYCSRPAWLCQVSPNCSALRCSNGSISTCWAYEYEWYC